MTDLPTPSKYHQPCWELTLHADTPAEQHYLVWGPGPITHDGHPTGETREQWSASWKNNDGERGDFTSGDTLEKVLSIFPSKVADLFRQALTKETT